MAGDEIETVGLPPRVIEFLDELPSVAWIDGGRSAYDNVARLLIVAGMPQGQVCEALQAAYVAAADSERVSNE